MALKKYSCNQCQEFDNKQYKYCAKCGNEINKGEKSTQAGMIVLNVFLLFVAIASLVLAYLFYLHKENFVWNILLAIGIALGPASIINLLYNSIIRKEIRTVIKDNYQDLNDNAKEQISEETNKIRMYIDRIKGLDKTGVIKVFPNRKCAVPDIIKMIELEDQEIYIVATSMKGLRKLVNGNGKNIISILKEKEDKNVIIKFLLTHPAFAYLRENSEQYKREVHLAEDVIESISTLKENNFNLDNVFLVKSPPTIFGILTSKHMLLNPYPYMKRSYKTLTLLLSNDTCSDVYDYYKEAHFHIAKDNPNIVPLKDVDNIEIYKKYPDVVEVIKKELSRVLS